MFGYVHEDNVEGGFDSWGVASASPKVPNDGSGSGSGSGSRSGSGSGSASASASASIPASAPELSVGSRVRMHGLRSRPDLNGTCGTVTQFASQSGRYHVMCEKDGEVMAFKPANLSAI